MNIFEVNIDGLWKNNDLDYFYITRPFCDLNLENDSWEGLDADGN
jgi:hypothetical protein